MFLHEEPESSVGYTVPENLRCCGNCEYLIWDIERTPYVKEGLRRNPQFHCKCMKKQAIEIYSLANFCSEWSQNEDIVEGTDGLPAWKERRHSENNKYYF